MVSLRKKIASYLAPLAASAALTMGGMARAENNPTLPPDDAARITQTATQGFFNPQDFRGKSFEQRMLQAEEAVQRYNLQNGTQFSDVFEIFLRQAPSHATTPSPDLQEFLGSSNYQVLENRDAINDSLEIVRLGCLAREIDKSLPCAEQLRSCGFDLLADIVENKTKMSDLSDEKRAEVLAQYETGGGFFDISNLMGKIVKQSKGKAYPISEDAQTLNGHKLANENLYLVKIAQQTHTKLNKEKAVLHSQAQNGTLAR